MTFTGISFLAAIAAFVTIAFAGRDYYDLLDVPRDAHVSVIKKSYRRLARLYHPDKHPGDKKMEDKFKGISTAYEVLTDQQKRQRYDNFGEEGVQDGGSGSGFGGFHQGQGSRMNFDASMFEDMFGSGFGGFDGAGFGAHFGGAGFDGGRRKQRQRQARKLCFQNKVCENGKCFMVKECKS